MDFPDFDAASFQLDAADVGLAPSLRWLQYSSNMHIFDKPRTGRNRAGVFDLLSRLNHSCAPNTYYCRGLTTIECHALRDIAVGEELTFFYDARAAYLTTEERRATFKRLGLPNPCLCSLCQTPGPEQRLSDDRRAYMRELLMMADGRDLEDVVSERSRGDIAAMRERSRIAMDFKSYATCRSRGWINYAQLAEAEGSSQVVDVATAYSNAATVVLQEIHSRSGRPPTMSELQSVKAWVKRAQHLIVQYHPWDLVDRDSKYKATADLVKALRVGRPMPTTVSRGGRYLELA